jgi:hypothetical protein
MEEDHEMVLDGSAVLMPAIEAIDPDRTYSLREASEATDLTREQLRLAIVSGRLPATQGANGWCVDGDALAAWLRTRAIEYPPVPTGFMTGSQAAARAGIGPAAAYRAIAAGHLPARWDGRRWLVADEDAEAWRPGWRDALDRTRPNS